MVSNFIDGLWVGCNGLDQRLDWAQELGWNRHWTGTGIGTGYGGVITGLSDEGGPEVLGQQLEVVGRIVVATGVSSELDRDIWDVELHQQVRH